MSKDFAADESIDSVYIKVARYFVTKSIIIYSVNGLRHMLPLQMNNILAMGLLRAFSSA